MRQTWIGLIHVQPEPDCEVLEQNAYVQAVAWVEEPEDFDAIVRQAAAEYRLHVMCIEDLEPLNVRLRKYDVEQGLLDSVKEIEGTDYLRFGTFHTYPAE